MLERAALTLGLCLLIAACAGGPHIPLSRLAGWRAVELGNTRVIADIPADELQRLASDLSRFDAIFTKLSGWAESSNTLPLTIYLFRDREVARRFGLGYGVGGWALGTLDGSFITALVAAGHGEGREVLFHEYTHILLARRQPLPLPRWYQEGLASYFSTLYWRNDAIVVGAAPAEAAARVRVRGALPLDQLFGTSTSDMDADEIQDFYATAWALSHYLLSYPTGRRELATFVNQVAHGVPSAEAQPAAFGRPLSQLGAELTTHVGYLARGVPGETLLDAASFAVPEAPRVSELAPREVAHAFGTLGLALVEAGELEDRADEARLARSFLSMALDDDAPDPRVLAALGEARALGGDIDGSHEAGQAALARAPGDAHVRLHAARIALLRAETKSAKADAPELAAAEAEFIQARTLAPESASAWFGLGQTYVRMGRSDAAFAAFTTARRHGWSAPLDIALARIHLARGERALAAELLRPIAHDPHVDATQKEAAELLKQAAP